MVVISRDLLYKLKDHRPALNSGSGSASASTGPLTASIRSNYPHMTKTMDPREGERVMMTMLIAMRKKRMMRKTTRRKRRRSHLH